MESSKYSSDEEDDYRNDLRKAKSHDKRSSAKSSRHKHHSSPDRRRRDRRSYSPRRSRSRERSSQRYTYEESRSHSRVTDARRKEKENDKSTEREKLGLKDMIDKECQNRIEGKAREKLSVLSKLGIELKLPEQDKKKKLWGDKSEPSTSVWNAANFADSKATAKFKRLMGIKTTGDNAGGSTSNVTDQQAKLFEKMEEEYEVARQTTHTMRGVGLGFPK